MVKLSPAVRGHRPGRSSWDPSNRSEARFASGWPRTVPRTSGSAPATGSRAQRFDEWVRALGTKGWAAPGWPKEYGGGGLDREHQAVLSQEMRAIKAPAPGSFGLTMLGPTILELGTDEQKRRASSRRSPARGHLVSGLQRAGSGLGPRRRADPGRTRGRRVRVTGQKIWTTGAPHADWIFCLVRTDPDASQARGDQLPPLPDEAGGCRGLSDPADRRL